MSTDVFNTLTKVKTLERHFTLRESLIGETVCIKGNNTQQRGALAVLNWSALSYRNNVKGHERRLACEPVCSLLPLCVTICVVTRTLMCNDYVIKPYYNLIFQNWLLAHISQKVKKKFLCVEFNDGQNTHR